MKLLILLAAAQFAFQNHTRRKYYIANYITVGVTTAANVYVSVWALGTIFTYKERYLTTVDFETMKMYSEIFQFSYTESTFWFDFSKVVFAVLLIVTAVNVLNFVWKLVLMKEEQKLIQAGKEGKAV